MPIRKTKKKLSAVTLLHWSFKGRKIIADTLVDPHGCIMFFLKVAVKCLRKMYHCVLAASEILTTLLLSLQACSWQHSFIYSFIKQ